jgi:predicted nucleotidyltransferase
MIMLSAVALGALPILCTRLVDAPQLLEDEGGRLRNHLPDLRQRYGVRSFALFGSYVRGEQTPDSDLDILVSFDDPPGLIAFIDLEDELSDLLGRPVDLVVEDGLKPRIGERVKREVDRYDGSNLRRSS